MKCEQASEIVNKNPMDLKHIPVIFRGNKDIVMIAVSKNGLALSKSTYELRSNKEVVIMAVKENGLALK